MKFTLNGETVRKSTGKKNMTEAMEYFRQFKPGLSEHDKKRLSDLKVKALEHAKANCKDKTYAQYENTFKLLIEILHDETLKNITKTDLQNYIGIREKSLKPDGTPYSKYTLNLEIAVIKKAFDIAHDKKWIAENPAKKLKKFKVKSTVPSIDDSEIPILLETIRNNTKNIHYYYAVVMALNTGMRKSEICYLKWNQVDFTDFKIELKNKINGETEYAFFNDEVMKIFSELKKSNIISSEGYVWGRALNIYNLGRTFRYWRDKLGLSKKIHFHSTRHTAITKWANSLNLHIAQDLARHSSPKQTKDYVHTKTEQLKQAINQFPVK